MRHGSGSASIWSESQVNDIRWTYARGKSKVWLPNVSKGVAPRVHEPICTQPSNNNMSNVSFFHSQNERFEIMINWHETHHAARINYLLSLSVLYFTGSTLVPLLPSRCIVSAKWAWAPSRNKKENIVVHLFDRGGFMFYYVSYEMAAWSQPHNTS